MWLGVYSTEVYLINIFHFIFLVGHPIIELVVV